jgi:predicted metalloprotease with PDZ domain
MIPRFLALLAVVCASAAAQTPVRLRIDATDVTRRVVHVQMNLPAKPGPTSLLYPEWIPGEHGPTGPVVNLVGLKITAGGTVLPWRRDSVNMYEFHVDVPAGASSLDVAFDFLAAPESEGFSSGGSTTSELAVLSWNQLLLYPKGANEDALQYQATLKVPQTWRYGTALPIQRESGNEIEFQPASLTTMVDSPISMGAHYKTIDLGADNGIPHYLNLAADSDRALEIAPETVASYKNLVKEAGALFGGARHYRDYHFLFTLSDHIAHFGLEHHESSDDRYSERTLVDPEPRAAFAFLLPHEFVHSWNGKYRRPAGLISGGKDGGYDAPMKGDLLWVYEGLTEYLGEVLTRRSGLWSPEDYREYLASTAADMDNTYGRRWRALEDTAVAAQLLYEAGNDYGNYRRSVDYYPEGSLIWLDVDVTIRRLSKGAKSLDDFCKTFHGGASGAPSLKPYTFEDVVAALNAVQPNDWAAFLNERVRSTVDHAPLGGIENAGWKLTYDGVRSDFWRAVEADHKLVDLTYSIGLKVKEDDGTIIDVRYAGPARKAGIAPSVKLIAVNGRQYTPTVLREAVAKTATDAKPIELLIKTGDYYETHRVEYTGGEKYPHLVRVEGREDLLSGIIAPRMK